MFLLRKAPVFCITCLVGVLSVAAFRFVQNVRFDQAVGGHLKRAADADQPALAAAEIQSALEGMDKRKLSCPGKVPCYTSIIYTTPDEDILFWRTNIEQTLEGLQRLPPELDEQTRSSVLLRVRKTLLDYTSEGESVTSPDGISIYPVNTVAALLLCLFTCLCIIFGFIWVVQLSRD